MEDITKTESGLFGVHTDRSEHEVSGDFSYITFNDVDSGETLAIITAYNGHGSVINFPAYIDGYKVIQIAATDNIGLNIPDDMLNSIFEVDIPGSIENIGANAFSNCKNLKRVILHDGLKRIGFSSFGCCESIEQLDIPDTVEVIENSAFMQTGIKEIKLPKEMKHAAHLLFMYCGSIKKVVFPENVETIGRVFHDSNTALEEIEVPTGNLLYMECRFYHTISETPWYKKQPSGWVYLDDCLIGYKLDSPNEMDEYDEDDNYIGEKCIGFRLKKGITKIFDASEYNIGEDVIIPDGVTLIGKGAICNEHIKKLTIPKSVKMLDSEALQCENLTEVEFMGDINYIINTHDSNYAGYEATKESIEEDSDGLFGWCPNLRCIKVHTERMKNYCEQHNSPYEFIEDTKPSRKSAKKSSSENSAPAGRMKFCPFCGGKLVANAPFCAFCGEKIPVI